MNRTEEIKGRAFARGSAQNQTTERDYWVRKAVLTCQGPLSHNRKRALIDCMLFDHYSIEIDQNELLVGRFSQNRILTEEERKESERGRELIGRESFLSGAFSGGTGHRVIDYEKLLGIGVKGVLSEIEERLNALEWSDPEAAEKRDFYLASKLSLEGLCRFASRYREALEELASREENPNRQMEYRKMAENFRSAPYEPCQTFYEALQCMWFVQFSLHLTGDTSLTGRFDQYMYPYYQKDVADGSLTEELARELIEGLYLKHNEIYGNWPASLMVGGVDRAGTPVWNELSRLCIESIETTGLINPSVAVAYNEAMPEELLMKCVDILSKGYTKPALFNDKIVQEGLREAGMPPEDARSYIHSTCVEITPVASSNVQVATPYINLGKAVEYLLGNGEALFGEPCQVEPAVYVDQGRLSTYEGFLSLAKETMAGIIRAHLARVCQEELLRERYTSCPLSSAFLNDCLERGKDSVSGGARYNYVYPCFPGFLNLVDMLIGIKHIVYEEKLMTLAELAKLCRTNFSDGERFRQYLLNRVPKFGNGIPESDALGGELYEFIRSELTKYRTGIGGTFHPSYFAWIMHGVLGEKAAASPDGRKQGEALSECLGSVQGMDKNGPIGVLRSIEKIDQKYGIGGIATNFRFSKSFIGTPEGKKAVADFIKVFMAKGCFELQINVVDQKTLLDAKERPEQYRTLMVRVAGYSDYFVNLSPEIQNEIIRRSEHNGI